jgi:3-hydroxybutyryl-CoA dehydrogenase
MKRGRIMNPNDVKIAAVVGAGSMGHSIPQVFAQAGIEVNLVDVNQGSPEHAIELIKSNLSVLVEFNRVAKKEVTAVLKRIHTSADLGEVAKGVDFVVEAVPEIPQVKKEVFSQLDAACSKDTVLASNTSGIDIFSTVEVGSPKRLIITHWFAPPHIIPLVEVVPGEKTSAEVISFATGLMQRLGKKPMVLEKFTRLFIVNRIQNAIGAAVLKLLDEGWASPGDIDFAVKSSLGIRLPIIGVVQNYDFTGIDVSLDIIKSLGRDNALLEEKVKRGELGAKTSKGFYNYYGRSEQEIINKRDRLLLKMLDHLENIHAFEPI